MLKDKQELKNGFKLILFAGIVFWVVTNINIAGNICKTILNILSPFIIGGCLAFLINIPMSFFERKMLNRKKKPKNKATVKVVSLILSILVIVVILALIIYLIVPELINVVKMLIDNMPAFIDEFNKVVEKLDINTEFLSNINVENIKNEVMNAVPDLLNSSISIVSGIIGTITNIVIAIIFAMYILMSKEMLKRQFTKLLYAYVPKEKAEKIIEIAKTSKQTFSKFFTVQCLEATILGTLCIIGMLILRIPYAVPIRNTSRCNSTNTSYRSLHRIHCRSNFNSISRTY